MGQKARRARRGLGGLCPLATRRAGMRAPQGKTSGSWDPERARYAAQSSAAQRPEGALGVCLLDTVPPLDVRRFDALYETATRGAPPFDPAMRGCLWLEAYGVGVGASRQSALAGARHWACRALVGQERPACRPLSDGRPQPLEACKE